MSESAAVKPFVLERNDHAVIVRPQMKMMDDEQLKTLSRLIDEAAGADSGITLATGAEAGCAPAADPPGVRDHPPG